MNLTKKRRRQLKEKLRGDFRKRKREFIIEMENKPEVNLV